MSITSTLPAPTAFHQPLYLISVHILVRWWLHITLSWQGVCMLSPPLTNLYITTQSVHHVNWHTHCFCEVSRRLTVGHHTNYGLVCIHTRHDYRHVHHAPVHLTWAPALISASICPLMCVQHCICITLMPTLIYVHTHLHSCPPPCLSSFPANPCSSALVYMLMSSNIYQKQNG